MFLGLPADASTSSSQLHNQTNRNRTREIFYDLNFHRVIRVYE